MTPLEYMKREIDSRLSLNVGLEAHTEHYGIYMEDHETDKWADTNVTIDDETNECTHLENLNGDD